MKNYRGRGWGFYCKNGVVIHIWGFSMEMEYRHCFSFVMVYGLSSNKVLYSTSNQFPYVNKNLLHFLNIKQQFSFMSWFLCLSRFSFGQYWEKWNKKTSKMRGCPGYISGCLQKKRLNLLHTMLETIVLWTRCSMYSISSSEVFFV